MRSTQVDEVCAERVQEARNIEMAHQYGVPVEEAFEHWNRDMVLLSYSKAPFVSEGFRRQAIEEFATARFIECHQANGQ